MSEAIDELVSSARLLGSTQAKKGFGCYTEEDSRFERAMNESIAKHTRTLHAELAAAVDDRDRCRLWAAHLRSALVVARMSLEQGQTIAGRVAANGPTIGEVIDGALWLEPKP
jgi:hypothetical protein